MEERVLILARRGRDAEVVSHILGDCGHDTAICRDSAELAAELPNGAGLALITEESLGDSDTTALARWLGDQPPWSDFPFILLATKRTGRRPHEAKDLLGLLGNVVVLERPIHRETICSAVDSALRGRRRQYEARRHLQDLRTAEETLRQFNVRLEERIAERTHELAHANDRLMQEIAERERAQAALVQSQKMEAVGQLTGGIAHDFNNLLTVIAGNLDLIQRRSDDDRLGAMAGYGLQAADRAAKLTRQLLAFSRTQRLNLEPVDINALLLGMEDMLIRSLGPEYDLEIAPSEADLWANADVNQLELAVLNLAINARDAMDAGGSLRIESTCASADDPSLRSGRYAVIRVIDNGDGIPEPILAKVFDPFFTTKPVGKGTGLGLSQVYGIAQQSGGTARVLSRKGEGCTVEIWLPLIQAGAAQGVEDRSHAPVGRPAVSVLVVEDDPAVRRFLVECLDALGHDVREAADGEAAAARLSEAVPGLMIVDYAMPGMNGVDVIKAARRIAPDLPILLATGYADMQAVATVVGPDQILRKPFQIADLEKAIAAILTPVEPAT